MEKQLAKEHGYYKNFTKDRLSDFKDSQNKDVFFTPAEEGRLLHKLLQSVSYEPVRRVYIRILYVCVCVSVCDFLSKKLVCT